MNNLKSLRLIILLMFVALCSLSVQAQHDHSNHSSMDRGGHTQVMRPPNGGVISDAGKYKIEMVAELFMKKDQLRFYLYKGNLKTILNKGITGTITIKYNDGEIVTQPLQAKGDAFFVAQSNSPNGFQATVKFIVKEKKIVSLFTIKGYGKDEYGNKKEDEHKEHHH